MSKKISFKDPISVSNYILILNQLLSNVDVKIIGEISEIKKAASGHIYFSLKDSKTNDIINCAIWKNIYNMYGIMLEDGMEVVVSGSADIYGVRGSLTFKVQTIERVGEGVLKKAYEELKKKLEKKGFFDDERKRIIPKYPQKIGVITSLKGAAIHDFTNNLGRFGFKLLLCDSRVEGQEAVKDLLSSLKTMSSKSIDVLVIIRGGGSLQSLLAFDNEMIVEQIIKFPVPVCMGIGHHEDVPLAALASDAHYSTPTAVANKLSENFERSKDMLIIYDKKITENMQHIIMLKKDQIYLFNEKIKESFQNIIRLYKKIEEESINHISLFLHQIKMKEERAKNNINNILIIYKSFLSNKKEKLNNYEKIILANSPEKQLELGYTITKLNNNVVKSITQLKKDDVIETIFCDGKIKSIINNKTKKHGK